LFVKLGQIWDFIKKALSAIALSALEHSPGFVQANHYLVRFGILAIETGENPDLLLCGEIDFLEVPTADVYARKANVQGTVLDLEGRDQHCHEDLITGPAFDVNYFANDTWLHGQVTESERRYQDAYRLFYLEHVVLLELRDCAKLQVGGCFVKK
jgi:hypothetical protein